MAYHVIEGKVVGKKEKIGIVCARFNEFIVSKLLGGAVDGLVRHGISEENIEQAIERAGTKAGNKGYDCAVSAIEMINLIKEIEN